MNDLPQPVQRALDELASEMPVVRRHKLRNEAILRANAGVLAARHGNLSAALELFALAEGYTTAAMREAA